MILLYATTNPAKLDSMRRVLDSLSIELTGLCDLNLPLPDVAETGKNPLENAVLKAKIYYEAFHTPLFPVTADCMPVTVPFLRRIAVMGCVNFFRKLTPIIHKMCLLRKSTGIPAPILVRLLESYL